MTDVIGFYSIKIAVNLILADILQTRKNSLNKVWPLQVRYEYAIVVVALGVVRADGSGDDGYGNAAK